MHNEGARVKAFAPFFIKNMAIQFRIYKNNGYIIAARYDTTASQYTDQTPVNIPAQYLAINIIKADPTDLIAFSCVAYEKPSRELARLPYNEIYDENGVLYSGSDVAAVRDSLTAALSGGSGGGGGGDATAANQTTQITEAQTTNAKLDAINATIAGQKTGISQQVFTDANGDVVLMRTTLDADGTPTLSWIDTTGAVVIPAQPVIPTDSALRTLNELVHTAINAGVDYNVDDVIIETQVLDLSVTPIVIISSLWYNSTQNIQIAAPLPADIRQVTETGLAKESTAQAILAQADDIRVNTQAANGNLEQILNNQFQPTAIGTETVTTAGVLASIGVIDCTELQYIELIVRGVFTGANLTVQGCNENTFAASPISQILPSPLNGAGAPVTAITTTDGNWKIPTTSKFIRLNLTAIVSGSLTAEVRLYKKPAPVQRVEQVADLAANQINGNQVSLDYVLAASMGLIAGVSVIQKSAYNPDVDIITAPAFQIVAAGGGFPYSGFVAADGNVQVVSSNAGDVGNIYVQYLADANSTAYQEGVIPVNGTTAQNSTFKAYRIHTAYYKPTNGNIYNLGTITIRQQATPTNIFAIMLPYTSQTNTGVYTVPAGKEVEILAASCTIGNATGGASSFIKTAIVHKSTTETSFRGRRPVQTSFGMQYTDPPTVVLRLPEKTDIMFVVTSANTNNTEVTFSATIIQKSNTP